VPMTGGNIDFIGRVDTWYDSKSIQSTVPLEHRRRCVLYFFIG